MTSMQGLVAVTAGIVSILQQSVLVSPHSGRAVMVVASHPADAWPATAGPGLSVHCYGMQPDASMRQVHGGGHLVMTASYLISARGDKGALEGQHLLAAAAVALHRRPVLEVMGPAGQLIRVQVMPETLAPEALAALWISFATPLQLCLTYAARGVLLDADPGSPSPDPSPDTGTRP